MPIQNTHPTIAAAEAIEDFDLGASPDGFNPEPKAADANGFIFNQAQPGQGAPVASKSKTGNSFASVVKDAVRGVLRGTPDVQAEPAKLTARQLVDISGGAVIEAPAPEPRLPLMKKIVSAPAVKAALAAVRSAQENFREVCAGTDRLIGHQAEAFALLIQIEACTVPAEILRLRALHAECIGEAAERAARAARRAQRVAHHPLAAALHVLFDAVAVELDKITVNTIAAEKAFLAEWSLPYTPGPLSASVAHLKARCAHQRTALDLSQGAERINALTPTDGAELVSIFLA